MPLLRRRSGKGERYRYLIPLLRGFATASSMFKPPGGGLVLVREYGLSAPFYPEGFVKVQVYENPASREKVYHVVEPSLTDPERRMYQEILNMLFYEPPEVSATGREELYREIMRAVDDLVGRLSSIYHTARPNVVRYYVYRETVGYSYIDPLLRDPYIEDISCNGPNQPVYVWHRDYEYLPTTLALPEEELDILVLKLAHMSGKHLSIANPIVDAILPEGHRLAATFRREVTTRGSTFTIRKFRERPITIVELIKWGTISPELAAYFWLMMEHKRNGLVMGVTGAGKTSLLNAIATLIKPTYKVVTVEDTPELRLPLPNWVQLVSREFGTRSEGAVEVTLFDLVKLSLRYRPDVIIVGEVRGEEAYVLFQAMASVSWDTPILVRDRGGRVRLLPIGEFVDRFYGNDHEEWVPREVEGYEVLSHNGYQVVWRPVRYVLRHRVDRIYRVVYEGGGELRATGSHSVFVLDPETLEVREKRVADLKPGELLVTLVGVNGDSGVSGEIDEDTAFLLGAYVAGGRVGGGRRERRVRFTLRGEDGAAERVLGTLWRRFRLKPAVIIDRGKYRVLEYADARVAEVLERYAGAKPEEKRVPPVLWRAPPSVVKAFFEGLKAGSRKARSKRCAAYTAARKDLALELLWLARLKGFYATYSEERGAGKNKGRVYYSVHVYTDKDYRKPSAAERVPAKALLRLAGLARAESVPLKLTYARRRKFVSAKAAEKIVKWVERTGRLEGEARKLYERIRAYINGNLRAVEVKEVREEEYSGFVYDLSVPETESFTGGNVPVLLHNTGHGGLSTIHAESLWSAVERLTSPPMNIPKSYIPLINFALLIRRVEAGDRIVRRVTNVWEVASPDDYVEVARWKASTDRFEHWFEKSVVLRSIAEMLDVDASRLLEEEIPKRTLFFRWLAERNIVEYREIAKHVSAFYADPEAKMKEVVRELGVEA